MKKISALVSMVLFSAGMLTNAIAAEVDLRHVVFESVSGKAILDTNIARGDTVWAPTDRKKIEAPSDMTMEYKYRWHRIGESGEEFYYPEKAKGIKVGDSIHYKAEITDTLYNVSFWDLPFVHGHLKSEWVRPGESVEPPEEPSHTGLVFDGWDNEYKNITKPLNIYAKYKYKTIPDYEFTITEFDYGSKAEDVKVKGPNKCFEFSKRIVNRTDVDGSLEDIEVDSVSKWDIYYLDLDIYVRCADDSVGNIWKYLVQESRHRDLFANVNGEEMEFAYNGAFNSDGSLWYFIFPVTFVDYDGTVLKQELVPNKQSATAPKAPVHEGKTFTGWNQKFDKVEDKLTVKAKYEEIEPSSSSAESSSSSAKAKSSSSSAKAKSSSSKAKSSSSSAKSSSSKAKSSSSKGKDAIVDAGQVPQFSLATVGREIQVAGARMGSAYAVLDMQGRVMQAGYVNSANFNLAMDRAGTYLVRIGNQTQTVKVK